MEAEVFVKIYLIMQYDKKKNRNKLKQKKNFMQLFIVHKISVN